MTRAKRPILALIIACLSLASAGLVVWKIPPTNIWIELGGGLLLAIGLGLGLGSLIGKRKISTLVLITILVTLILNRLEILNWVTYGLLVAVVGLISLIN